MGSVHPRHGARGALAVVLTALSALASHCGARSGLEIVVATPDASAPAADVPPSVDVPTLPDVPPRACEWALGEAAQLSDGVEDLRLEALAVADDRALVAMQVSDADPPHDRAWQIRAVGLDATPLAPARVAISQPAYDVAYSAASLALTPRWAAAAWDERRGCRFAFVDREGAGQSVVSVLGFADRCFALAGLPDGYTLLQRERRGRGSAVVSVVLNARGAATGERADLAMYGDTNAPDTFARAFLPDGTFVFGAASRTALTLTRHTAEGRPIGAAVVPTGTTSVRALRLTARPDGVTAAWIENFPTGARMRVWSLDARGQPLGAPYTLDNLAASQAGDLSIAHAFDRLLIAWSEGPAGLPNRLRLQVRSNDAVRFDRELIVEEAFLATNPVVRATPTGALVAYEAERGRMPVTVYIRALACR